MDDKNIKKMVRYHDNWADTYDLEYFYYNKVYHAVTLNYYKEYLKESGEGIILDAGGGTGIWSVELAKLGFDVVLIELSDKMLEKAEEKIEKEGLKEKILLKKGNILDLSEFNDEYFEAVACEGDLLSYCGDPERALKEIWRVLKTSGKIFASVDNKYSLIPRLLEEDDIDGVKLLLEEEKYLFGDTKDKNRFYVDTFTPDQLKNMVEDCGFRVLRLVGKTIFGKYFIGLQEHEQLLDWAIEI